MSLMGVLAERFAACCRRFAMTRAVPARPEQTNLLLVSDFPGELRILTKWWCNAAFQAGAVARYKSQDGTMRDLA
jgi:hypothetical protein